MSEDLSLPKAPVVALIKESLPEDISMANAAKELIRESCNELLQVITTEMNDVANANKKNLIAGPHLTQALKNLDMPRLRQVAVDSLESTKQSDQAAKNKKAAKASGLSDAQLLENQKRLLQNARANQSKSPATPSLASPSLSSPSLEAPSASSLLPTSLPSSSPSPRPSLPVAAPVPVSIPKTTMVEGEVDDFD